MPRNRKIKQATPLATKPIQQPGFFGLNTEIASGSVGISDQWASVLTNMIFDDLGRIALRKGYADATTTAMTGTPDVVRLYEYVRTDETTSIIAVSDDYKIWESTDDGDTWTDISGGFTTDALASTDVQFATLDGILFATAPGFKVYQFTTALGSFTQIADSVATRGVIHSAFGRVWIAQDATDSIRYSGLLDGTDWTTTSAGSIDAANVWTNGQDTIRAIASFGATFIVFGTQHILMYVDGAGSVLGIDPDNMYVVDTIEGTGCEHQNSIVNIGEGDMWFVSNQGVQSLARVIEDKVNPLVDISANVKSWIQNQLQLHTGSNTTIQAIYSPENRFVIFNFPEQGVQLVFDTRFALEDGTFRASTWDITTEAVMRRRNGNINLGLVNGEIGLYSTYADDGSTIVATYASPWMHFGPDLHASLKIMKSFDMFIYGEGTLSGTARWGYDFRPLEFSQAWSNVYVSSGAEWGDGEWGSGEFSEGKRMRKEHIPAMGQGQFVKFYTTIQSSTASKLSIQELDLSAKIGRRVN